MRPLVSIVIPTYNRAHDLKRALMSVQAQTYPHWEVLVVDNHSSDRTDDVIQELGDPRIRIFKIHNDGIIAASRNLGIRNAQGEYVAFLDSDDWWMPEKLEESLKYFERGADVVYHNLYVATKANQRFFWRKARTRDLISPVFNDLIVAGNSINNSSVVVRRALLCAIGGLSEDRNLIAGEDYDAWLRIAKLTEKFKKIPKTLGYYWTGGGNASNPSRLLSILDVIEERYADAFSELGAHHGIFWLSYAKGSAYYRLGSYKMARKYFELIRWRQAPFSNIIKGYGMLLLINLYHHS